MIILSHQPDGPSQPVGRPKANYPPTLTTPPMKGFLLTTSLVFFVSASLPAALPRGGAAERSSVSPRSITTMAVISGLEEKIFQSLPPVLVELSNLPASAAVWVEVVRGQVGVHPVVGRTIESKFYLRRRGVGILSVPGIHKACRSGGAYTLMVKMSDTRGTVVLSQTSFELVRQRVVRR